MIKKNNHSGANTIDRNSVQSIKTKNLQLIIDLIVLI